MNIVGIILCAPAGIIILTFTVIFRTVGTIEEGLDWWMDLGAKILGDK